MRLSLRVLPLALAVLAMLVLTAGPALAQAPNATAEVDLLAQEGGEAFRGTLSDPEGEPVPGVTIVVTTAAGEAVGEIATDEDGEWSVALPGPGDYVATLDQTTLPEGAELRDPDNDSRELSVNAGQERTVLFPLGELGARTAFWSRFLTAAFSGLQFGLIIAIAAIGLSLIFGTTGLVNFAHGDMVTFGAVVAWFLNAPDGTGAGLQLIIAGAIAVVLSAGLGAGIELGLWRPLRRRRTGLIQMLVITIGLSLVLRNIIQIAFGGSSRPYFDYTIQQRINLGPLSITPRDLIVSLVAAGTLIAVATMLQRTRIGKAMRAVSDNRDLAESSGIDVQRVVLFVWVLGAGLAGFGGILNGLVENVNYLMGFRLLLLMFAAVILGGLGTAYGAMFGAIVVGLVTELSTLFFSTELKFVWALFVLIIILLVRPQGLLGRRERIG